ncbi:MAG: CBS domain-containing protein [Calditrichaeota bacterium]|nr:MAG: CBS domain-containing protein [Calditrichota bacterium]
MGESAVKRTAKGDVRNRFIFNMLRDIRALEIMLERGLFESGVERIGAEQEMCLVDQHWKPAPVNMSVLSELNDPHYTTELARFNMEMNLDPLEFTGSCLSTLENQLRDLVTRVDQVAERFNAHPILTGILPTIHKSDLEMENITPNPRYRILSDLLVEFRGGSFELHISGTDELITKHQNILFEACNTSFQVHYQIEADEFVDKYNWAQAISGPILAQATNSPLLLGKRLWRETRIALFQQSIDIRKSSKVMRDRIPRVFFGTGWVRNSILELFQEDIARHEIIFSADIEEDALRTLEEGGIPKLKALLLHNGSIYKWNRPVYGITDGKPHLRIENRLFPSGPTVVDEMANTAFWLGLMKGMPDAYRNIDQKMDFDDAKTNFIKAARMGLGAQFRWFKHNKMIPSDELIIKELIPIAREGLKKAKIDRKDITRYLDIIQQRVETQRTGSQWVVDTFSRFKKEVAPDEALVATTAGIYYRQKEGKPVHTWSKGRLKEGGSWVNRYKRIHQIMSTDLFTVREEDLINLVTNIMDWRNFHHIPVENSKGELKGLISSDLLIHYFGSNFDREIGKLTVKDIMIKNPVTVKPDMLTVDALRLMRRKDLKYLLVVQEKKLVGIVTEYDFVRICQSLFEELESGQ